MDKNSEPKEVCSDDQHQCNQCACTQHMCLQGQSLRNHCLNSKDCKEVSAEVGQPLHGHSAHFTCHATQWPEQVLGKEVQAQQRRHHGGW